MVFDIENYFTVHMNPLVQLALENAIMNAAKEMIPDEEHDIEDIRKVIELSNFEFILDSIMSIEDEDAIEEFIEKHIETIGVDEPLFTRYLNIVFVTALLCKHANEEVKE
jgi:macrodomain Ter protein organizer (MatP/YcbG family)